MGSVENLWMGVGGVSRAGKEKCPEEREGILPGRWESGK